GGLSQNPPVKNVPSPRAPVGPSRALGDCSAVKEARRALANFANLLIPREPTLDVPNIAFSVCSEGLKRQWCISFQVGLREGQPMSNMPDTRYAKSDDTYIAYQIKGEGPFDLVFVPGFISHVEMQMELPIYASFFGRLASFCRVIRFDKRGTGLSD